MTEVETRIKALNHDVLELGMLGGEDAVYREAADLSRSSVFGDVVGALVRHWSDLADWDSAGRFISDGLKVNLNRLTFIQAIEELVEHPNDLMKSVRHALELRVRDEGTPELLRVDAATGLVRFAILEKKSRSAAMASIQALEELTDPDALAMLCRLAAFGWEQFRDDGMVELLERHADLAQAAYERGVIGIGLALEAESLAEIETKLGDAHAWLKRSLEADGERRDARVYATVTNVLLHVARSEPTPANTLDDLRRTVIERHIFDQPAPGYDWLLPPHEAELEWIPVVDRLVQTSCHLSERSWIDTASALGEMLRAYSTTRAVRPGLPGIERVLQPAIEAAFVRERGFLARLAQLTDNDVHHDFNPSDLAILRSNIEAQIKGSPPGK